MTESLGNTPGSGARTGWLAQLHLAASFLTRVPVPDPGHVPGGLGPAMRCFPLVGAGIGLAAGAAFAVLPLPPMAGAMVAVLVMVLMTGALHEDGLADLADGLGARGGLEARLAVMRDSRIGAFGVMALIFSVGLRVAALAAIPQGWGAVAAMMTAAALSRAMIPVSMQIMGPARSDGLGAGAGVADATVAATAALIALVLAVAGLGLAATLGAALAAMAASLGVTHLARRALGGYTGDVLGAVQQASEVAILLALAAR